VIVFLELISPYEANEICSEKRRAGSKMYESLLRTLVREAAYRFDENELLPYAITEESVFSYKLGKVELNQLIYAPREASLVDTNPFFDRVHRCKPN
jgi:hypothetical protein